MKEFTYTIKDEQGIHARPAGELVKAAAAYPCKVTISKDGKEVDAKRILGVMGLGVKCGQEIVLKTDGDQEEKAYAAYTDRKDWAKKALINISKAGFFSSDRTIDQYNKEIWKLS